jgi:hypothetical protein
MFGRDGGATATAGTKRDKNGPVGAIPRRAHRAYALGIPFGEESNRMNSATFKIEGMHCDGCARTIKALISAEPGVQAAEVSFKDG